MESPIKKTTSTMLPGKRNQISSIRKYLPQALACLAKGFTIMNHALALSLPAIVIPALTGLNPANNPNEHLSITSEEASWIASIYTLNYVIGSVMSGALDPLGRKKSLMFGNIPYFIGWLSLYYSNSLWSIYILLAVMGYISGLLESPIVCYLSEIAEPHTRTVLLSTTNFTFEISAALIFFLGNHMPWRQVNLYCAAVPICAVSIMIIVPETPHWLLSHNRSTEALKSLQWLRGWVESCAVKEEFDSLQRYKAIAYVCYACEKQSVLCNHPQPTISERFRDFRRRKTIIPFFIVICLYSNSIFCSAIFRPFLVPILNYFKSPIDPNEVLVWAGYAGLLATTLSIIIIRFFGRRFTHLISLVFAILTLYVIAIYGFLEFSQGGVGSFLYYVSAETARMIPVNGFLFLLFLLNLGLRSVPNLLVCEIFSYRSKSLATGIALAFNYIGLAITAKTFYLLQAAITLPGQCVFYATIGVIGLVIIYIILPETEGRTLQDIEMYFSNKNRKFNDLQVPETSFEKEISASTAKIETNK